MGADKTATQEDTWVRIWQACYHNMVGTRRRVSKCGTTRSSTHLTEGSIISAWILVTTHNWCGEELGKLVAVSGCRAAVTMAATLACSPVTTTQLGTCRATSPQM